MLILVINICYPLQLVARLHLVAYSSVSMRTHVEKHLVAVVTMPPIILHVLLRKLKIIVLEDVLLLEC